MATPAEANGAQHHADEAQEHADSAQEQADVIQREVNHQAGERHDEANLLPEISRAAKSAADKDDLTAQALRESRRSRRIIMALAAVIAVGTGYVAQQAHDQNDRSASNSKVLYCSARGVDDVLRDVRILAKSHLKAPESAYPLPPGCQLVP